MIRRARSLILDYQGRDLVALNYLSKKSCVIQPWALALLSALDDWQYVQSVYSQFPEIHYLLIERELSNLISSSIIVQFRTLEGERDLQFERDFVWGAPVGHYHFSIRGTSYMDPVQFSDWMTDKVESVPPIPLYRNHTNIERPIPLPDCDQELDVVSVMRRRRSFRGFSDQPVPLKQLADCLFSGLGITGFVKGSIEGEGFLPLSMTPSGGGRNPYEAYVYVVNVEGLKAGTYHYSAKDHSLALANDVDLPKPGTVLANQPWFDNTAALILLVANFERTMWKYPHPTGYRVVVLEAGHIAQNIILTATAHGLASAPTCAISDSDAEKLTGCTGLSQTTMYSIAIGQKAAIPTAVDPIHILPNVPVTTGIRSSL
jgi:SagB-type dehydrogenase family enzyme